MGQFLPPLTGIRQGCVMPRKEPFNLAMLLTRYWWQAQLIKLSGRHPIIDLGHDFIDIVTRKSLCNYQDGLGRYWMADSGR
jgi:hypothetical protein